MEQSLLGKLAPRLKSLDTGGYARGYFGGERLDPSSVHQVVRELLDSLRVPYKADVEVKSKNVLKADFLVNGILVFISDRPSKADVAELGRRGQDCVFIAREALRSDRFDHGLRVVGLEERGDLQTIFLDDPSFNFDYAHILPRTKKCSVMHGHTSSVLVEVVGKPVDGMVVDFGVAKDVVREAMRSLDHKLFIDERYATTVGDKAVTLKFKTVHGEFAIRAPRATTVMMEGEATVENLAREVLSRIAPGMPKNVTAIGVYVYEGMNKGSHVLAQIHEHGVRKQRKKR